MIPIEQKKRENPNYPTRWGPSDVSQFSPWTIVIFPINPIYPSELNQLSYFFECTARICLADEKQIAIAEGRVEPPDRYGPLAVECSNP